MQEHFPIVRQAIKAALGYISPGTPINGEHGFLFILEEKKKGLMTSI